MKTIAIIGGGAAGLMAAYAASRTNENHVILYERQARVGRKLLATGNGRCNLTNLNADVSHYHGANPAFVRPALEALSVGDTLALFRDLGLLTTEGEGGRMYPLSDSANSVLDVLRFAIDRENTEETRSILEKLFAEYKDTEISIDEKVAKIMVMGDEMQGKPGVAASVFRCLWNSEIHIINISASEIGISMLVNVDDAEAAMECLNRDFRV